MDRRDRQEFGASGERSESVSTSDDLRPERLLEHAAWVKRLAARLVWDAASADDVAQETMVVALQAFEGSHGSDTIGEARGFDDARASSSAAGRPREPSRLRAWLAAIARNVVRRAGRSRVRREARERAAATSESLEATDEIVARASLQRAVVDAVLALPEPYRTTILLRFFDELPTHEIAQRRDEPVETVRTRLKRGLAMLRLRLARELEVETKDGTKRGGLAALAMLIEPRHATATASTTSIASSTSAAKMNSTAKTNSTVKTSSATAKWASVTKGPFAAVAAALVVAAVSWIVARESRRAATIVGDESPTLRSTADVASTASSNDGAFATGLENRENDPLAATREELVRVESKEERVERLRSELTLDQIWKTKGVEQDTGPEIRAAVQGLVKRQFDYGALLDYLNERIDEGWVVRGSYRFDSGVPWIEANDSWIEAYENSKGDVSFVRIDHTESASDVILWLPLVTLIEELAPGVGFGEARLNNEQDRLVGLIPEEEIRRELVRQAAIVPARQEMRTSLQIVLSVHGRGNSVRVDYVGVGDRSKLSNYGCDGVLPSEMACNGNGLTGTLAYYVSRAATGGKGDYSGRRFDSERRFVDDDRALTKHENEAAADLEKLCAGIARAQRPPAKAPATESK